MKDKTILLNNSIDVEASLELFGDMETYNETLNDFLESVFEKLEEIKIYKEAKDMPNYAILVHSLKSDSKYLGFTKLAELSYQHELESKANNLEFVLEHYDELINEANRVINVVRKYLGEDVNVNQHSVNKTIENDFILIVDDSDIIRNFIQKIFKNQYEIMVAKDGKEAIDIISVADPSKVGGMFLDLNMPNIDGFQVLDYLKENNLFEAIPTSIITGDDSKEAIGRAFKYPIVDMLNKPFNEKEAKLIVQKTINHGK